MKKKIHCKKPGTKMLKVYIGFGNKMIVSNSTKNIYTEVVGQMPYWSGFNNE